MELPPSITDDLRQAQYQLGCDQSPNWLAGYAAILRGIAKDIDRAVESEKNRLEAERPIHLTP